MRPVCLRLAHRQPPWLAAPVPAPALSPLLLIPGVAEPPVRMESSILLHSSPLLRSLASSCCCTTTILLPFTTGAALHCLCSLLATGATTTSPPLLVQLQELLAILQIDIQTERVPLAPRPPARAAGRPRSATVARIDLTKAPPAATGRKVAGTIDDEAAFRPPQPPTPLRPGKGVRGEVRGRRKARPPASPSVPRSATSARARESWGAGWRAASPSQVGESHQGGEGTASSKVVSAKAVPQGARGRMRAPVEARASSVPASVAEIDAHLAAAGLPLRTEGVTPGDGNCWYHAMGAQVRLAGLLAPAEHGQLRRAVAAHVRHLPAATREHLATVLSQGPGPLRGQRRALANLACRQKRDGEYVDDDGVMALATAALLERNIEVSPSRGPTWPRRPRGPPACPPSPCSCRPNTTRPSGGSRGPPGGSRGHPTVDSYCC